MNGFELFGQAHILWLGIFLLSMLLVWLLGRRAGKKGNLCLSWMLALFAFLSHLAESGLRIREGSYGIDTLPLHICALASYLVIIHRLHPKKRSGELLFCPGIAGALCALLSPDWTSYPPFSMMSAVGFISHIAIILYALHAIGTGLITPSVKRIYIPVVSLAVYAALLIPFDRHFNVNYGFLNGPSPGSILVPLAKRFGYGTGYYVGYGLLVLAGILVCYMLYYLIRPLMKQKKTRETGRTE